MHNQFASILVPALRSCCFGHQPTLLTLNPLDRLLLHLTSHCAVSRQAGRQVGR